MRSPRRSIVCKHLLVPQTPCALSAMSDFELDLSDALGEKADKVRRLPHRVRTLNVARAQAVRPRAAHGSLSTVCVHMEDGSWHWYRGSHLHRGDGMPAIERLDGSAEWYEHGVWIRSRPPIVDKAGDPLREPVHTVFEDGTQEWRLDGALHRLDGPAWIHWSGFCKYFRFGYLHRSDGPAWIQPRWVVKYYRLGRLHRDDGPAIVHVSGALRYYRAGHHVCSNLSAAIPGAKPPFIVPMGSAEEAEASAQALTGGLAEARKTVVDKYYESHPPGNKEL